MDVEKEIEDLAEVIDERLDFANAVIGSMNKGKGYWIAEGLFPTYRKAEEVRKETAKRIYQRLYDLCTKNNPFGAYDLLKEDVLGWAKEDGVEIEECKTVDFEDIEQSDVIELPYKQLFDFGDDGKFVQVVYRGRFTGLIHLFNAGSEPEADAFLAELKGGKR